MVHFKTFFQQIRYFRDLSQYSYGFVYIKDRRGKVYSNKWKKRCIWSLIVVNTWNTKQIWQRGTNFPKNFLKLRPLDFFFICATLTAGCCCSWWLCIARYCWAISSFNVSSSASFLTVNGRYTSMCNYKLLAHLVCALTATLATARIPQGGSKHCILWRYCYNPVSNLSQTCCQPAMTCRKPFILSKTWFRHMLQCWNNCSH